MQPSPASERPNERYRLDRDTLGRGTYAEVIRAVNKADGTEVALKRALQYDEARSRIKREIEAQKQLAHPNIMPIWDNDPACLWYTMPVAAGTLRDFRDRLGEEEIASILLKTADALHVAHEQDLIHRDISPQNILALPGSTSGGLRWVVADWGMVRFAPEMVSRPLTRPGQQMGTPGFDAPELDVDPSSATPAVDVYSLGRVAAWFLTGEEPRSGVSLLPDESMIHWRPFVRSCTQQDVNDRVASMLDLRSLLNEVFADRDEPVLARAERLTEAILLGSGESVDALMVLAANYPEDSVLFLDFVAQVPTARIHDWTTREPSRGSSMAIAMAKHVTSSPWDGRDRQYATTPLTFALTVLRALVDAGQLGLAQDVAGRYFEADAQWQMAGQRMRTLEWLADLGESAAGVMWREMSTRPNIVDYYRESAWTPRSVILRTMLGR